MVRDGVDPDRTLFAVPQETGDGTADTAQRLPEFPDWTLLCARTSSDGRLLLHGRPIEAREAVAILDRHPLHGERVGIVLVATAGLAAAQALAAATGRPVVATAGRVVVAPGHGELSAGEQGWMLVSPRTAPVIPLGENLSAALVRAAARCAPPRTGGDRG